ncbi:MAG: ROK family protein [Clostridia bacterium]
MARPLVVGVDLGGTKVATAVARSDAAIVSRVTKQTEPERGLDAVVATIIDSVREAVEEAGAKLDDVAGVGVGSPGPLNPETGTVIFAPNLGWHDVPLVALMEQALNVPVHIENDANLAALGEARYGAGRGSKNMIYITVSTGIGGGLILGGEIYSGSSFAAGEVGHMTITDEDGSPQCGCGNYGCLEALASGPAIARMARELIRHGEETMILDLVRGNVELVTSEVVGRAALAGDAAAIAILGKAADYLGIGIANLVNILNPDTVVIGGGVSKVGEILLKPVREVVAERALKPAFEAVKIVRAELGADAGVVGAVCLVLSRLPAAAAAGGTGAGG